MTTPTPPPNLDELARLRFASVMDVAPMTAEADPNDPDGLCRLMVDHQEVAARLVPDDAIYLAAAVNALPALIASAREREALAEKLREVTAEYESCMDRDRVAGDSIRDMSDMARSAQAELTAAKVRLAEVIEERDHQYAINVEQIATEADLEAQLAAERTAREAVEEERDELRRAFGAISLAVAASDGGSDNTPWQDVVERIETTGRRLDLSRKLHEQSSRERIAAEQRLQTARAALEQASDTLRVPAAEYVPAIPDAFAIIDAALRATEVPTAHVPRCSICRRDDCHQQHACE